jgi:hypothetical protein
VPSGLLVATAAPPGDFKAPCGTTCIVRFYNNGLVSAAIDNHYRNNEAYEYEYTSYGIFSGDAANQTNPCAPNSCGSTVDTGSTSWADQKITVWGTEVIEYVTWSGNSPHWGHGEDHIFYLEILGEATPRMTPAYTQLPIPERHEASRHSTNLAPVYEYYWSIGYIDPDKKCGPETWGGELANTAAEIYLYFPTIGGWRIEELLATVKYLCPGREHSSLLQNAAHMFSTAQPIVDDASKLATASGVPGVGLLAASTASLLDVIGRLKLTSVPPEGDYKWCVQKVDEYIKDEGLLHGVKWTIPKKLFVEFGSRLTGSIAVNVIPAIRQAPSAAPDHIQLRRLPIRAAAVMYPHARHSKGNEPIKLPPDGRFLELEIEPRALEIRESSSGPLE